MDKNEEKLLRAVEGLGMATVPALADATKLSEREVTDWIEKAESEGLIAPRNDQNHTDHDDPDKSGSYPSWGLEDDGLAALSALGSPKLKDGFWPWFQSKLAGS